MPLVRTRAKGNDDAVIQVKRPWLPRGFNFAWKDWTLLSAYKNQIEVDIAANCSKLLVLAEQYKEASQMLKAEMQVLKADRWGYGPPRRMSTKDFNKLPRGVRPVSLDWKAMLSRAFLRMFGEEYRPDRGVDGKQAKEVKDGINNVREVLDVPDRGSGHRTAYTLPDSAFKAHGFQAEDVGADSHLEFKEPKPDNQQKSKQQRREEQRQHQQRNQQDNSGNES